MKKSKSRATQETAAMIRDNYSTIWPPILRPWTDYLIASRRAFDGDLDAMLILAAIGTMTLRGFETGQSDLGLVAYGDMLAPDYKGPDSQAINVESVAAFVGIPKETVRRKVNLLISRGWVARGESSTLSATKQSAADLAELSSKTFTLLACVSAAIQQ